MTVKPLEWQETGTGQLYAATLLRGDFWIVRPYKGRDAGHFQVTYNSRRIDAFLTLEEAQECAQQHYTSLVMSLLV